MILLRERVEQNPVKWYLFLVYSFTLFFLVLFVIIGGTTFISINPLIEVWFNSTNTSLISSDITTSGFQFSLDFLASLITFLGVFGGFCYLFFSIHDGKIAQNDEIQYTFVGFLIVILFIDIILAVKFFMGWQTEKIIEIGHLTIFPLITVIFAIFFKIVFSTIEENYGHRIAIIDFLKKSDERIIISPRIDSVSRAIFQSNETFTIYIFILFVGMAFYGIFQGFNPLTIISTFVFSLTMFLGYSRLISLTSPTSDIELISHNNRSIASNSSQLSDIFIIKESANFFTILTNSNDNNKILTFSKSCICTIKDNDYIIFEEEKHPFAIWIITRLVRTLLTMLAFSHIFYFFVIIIPINQNWILFFVDLLSSLFISISAIFLLRKWIDGTIEEIIKFLSNLLKNE